MASEGLAALAPNGLLYELGGAQRSQIPSSGIGLLVHEVAQRIDPGIQTHLYSGQEPSGRKPVGAKNRHPRGYAGDFYFTKNGKKVTDERTLKAIAIEMARRHGANIGYDARPKKYMGPGNIHIDIMPLGKFGGGAQWGATAKQWAKDLIGARRGVDRDSVGLPETGPVPPPRSRDTLSPAPPAPYGDVERGSTLAALAPPSRPAPALMPAARTAAPQRAAPPPRDRLLSKPPVRAASVAPTERLVGRELENVPTIASRYQLGGRPVEPQPNVSTPKGDRLSALPREIAQSRAVRPALAPQPELSRLEPVQPTAPRLTPVAPTARLEPVAPQRLEPVAPTERMIGVEVPEEAPLPTAAIPEQPPAPALPPPRYVAPPPPVFQVAPAPALAPEMAMQQAPEPSLTPGDIWGGMTGSARTTGGHTVSRENAWGPTVIENRFGARTAFDDRGIAGAVGGPLGSGGILGSDFEMGSKAKKAAGGMAGSAIGGLLGPVGSILGAAIGMELTKPNGGRIGDMLKGVRTIDTSNVPGFGQTTQFAKAQGGLAFPSAPTGGGPSNPSYSGRSMAEMERISPKAAKDIQRGRAGLF